MLISALFDLRLGATMGVISQCLVFLKPCRHTFPTGPTLEREGGEQQDSCLVH